MVSSGSGSSNSSTSSDKSNSLKNAQRSKNRKVTPVSKKQSQMSSPSSGLPKSPNPVQSPLISLFSRRILEENEPDYYSGKFFFSFFFVRPQNVCVVDTFYRTTKSTAPASGIISELLQRVPPFVYSIFNVRYKTGRNYRVPPLNFFRHCATFFSKFF